MPWQAIWKKQKIQTMSRQTIELSGIVRNLPDDTVKDGTMQELINLRPKDGALRPVGPKSKATTLVTDARFIHSINDSVKVHIGTSGGGYIAYWIYEDGVYVDDDVTTVPSSSNMVFASLSNTLMISDKSTEKTYLLLFDQADNTYLVYDQLPDVPNITFSRNAVTGDDFDDTFDTSLEGDYGEALLSQYVQGQKEVADKDYLTGVVLLRAAWELFDGTLVKHTLPDLIMTSKLEVTGSVVGDYYQVARNFDAFEMKFSLNVTSDVLNEIKSAYKNIIRSLKIFVTLPKSPEITDSGERTVKRKTLPFADTRGTLLQRIIYGTVTRRLTYDVKDLSKYIPDPLNVEYFLLKEYKLAELKDKAYSTAIENETLNDLATREQISVDNLTHHNLYGKSLFAYNERIFLGNIKNTLYKGFSLDGILNLPDSGYAISEENVYEVGIEYDIVTSSRDILTLFTGWSTWKSYTTDLSKMYFRLGDTSDGHNSYWGYPDSRAITARILIKYTGTIKLAETVQMKSNQESNFAFASSLLIQVTFSALQTYSLIEDKTTYYDYNRIQATEINNPFSFPAINSYRIGLGRILGMSTNAIALSQGQFGQFPIYCFTTDGIWTMNIGTGEILINTISPLSREVCNNSASIIPIDGGTVFSTSKGLFIISGAIPIEISEFAEGSHAGHLTGLLNYEAVMNNPNLYEIKDYLCSAGFLTYLSGAKIAWDYINKEIIISNNTYKYSWVFSLTHKMWFKISQVFDNFVPDFPVYYGYHTEDTIYYQSNLNEESFTDLVPVHIETRPLKLSASTFKKIIRLLVQGYINENDEYPFSVNLFGSTDKIKWLRLNSGTTFGGKQPMLIGRSTFTCKHYILVAGGKIDEEAWFSAINVDSEDRYNNKLR